MIKEYDVVKAKKQLDKKVTKGTIGTVLLIYQDSPFVCEVEFVSLTQESLAILTVYEEDIDLYIPPLH